tara:strand:- start:729 stop:1343 length:615 start_codon:yes stop_codon:yes gene_type:complete
MNLQKTLIYGGIGYLAYRAFFQPKDAQSSTGLDLGQPIFSTEEENMVGSEGKFYFRYAGSSALRVDEKGNRINCGIAGNPYSVSGIEGNSARTGVAPTTYYALFELGSERSVMEGYPLPNANLKSGGHKINVGDRLQLTLTGGQFSALENQIVTVIQLGSDTCNASGNVELQHSSIVVDLPIILEGAGDAQYPAAEAYGYGMLV